MTLESATIPQIYLIFSELPYFQIRKLTKHSRHLKRICKRPEFKDLISIKLRYKIMSLMNRVQKSQFKPNLHLQQIKLSSTKKYRQFFLSYCDSHFWIEEYVLRKDKPKILYTRNDRHPCRQLAYLLKKCYIV